VRAHDQRDFDAFVVARTPALLRTAFLLTGSREAAQDLLQESLVRLHGRWTRVRDIGAREAYLRRILATRASNDRRRRWHGEVPTESLPAGTGPDPYAEVDERHAALDVLRGLTPAHRAVLVLRFFEDLSEAQTAELLGVSVGTVKSRTSRALAQLRAQAALELGGAR
jgi:RNA polymerase sigma-70 factor (sigma-E family)